MQQAQDFLAESEALHTLLAGLSDADFERETAFKHWTINTVLRHLHVWNLAALRSLTGDSAFDAWLGRVATHMDGTLTDFERDELDGLHGKPLVEAWRATSSELAARFAAVDSSVRVKWVGPSMSARSAVTARLMETWAHGQAIYDLLGVVRRNEDRIGNIVVLGVRTYDWTYRVRGEQPPGPMPRLTLTAPSGEIWRYAQDSESGSIKGSAEAFCQVVTQTRNVADTDLVVSGSIARDWMGKAQCFAGPPHSPPAQGTRGIR